MTTSNWSRQILYPNVSDSKAQAYSHAKLCHLLKVLEMTQVLIMEFCSFSPLKYFSDSPSLPYFRSIISFIFFNILQYNCLIAYSLYNYLLVLFADLLPQNTQNIHMSLFCLESPDLFQNKLQIPQHKSNDFVLLTTVFPAPRMLVHSSSVNSC